MLYLAICDDIKEHREYTARLAEKYIGAKDFEIEGFDSAEALLKAVGKGGYSPDIAILDIVMGSMDGIELAKELNSGSSRCSIIFLSGFDEYKSDVYEAEHIYFIHKPETEKYLPSALAKAVKGLSSKRQRQSEFVLSCHGRVTRVTAEEVLYLERRLRKTLVVTAGCSYEVKDTPAELLTEETGPRFIQCHQSYWVNFSRISEMDTDAFRLDNGMLIPISRSKKQVAREQFFRMLESKHQI